MGYKRPICFEDFGKDKALWSLHIKEEHKGVGFDLYVVMTRMVEGEIKNKTKEKMSCQRRKR